MIKELNIVSVIDDSQIFEDIEFAFQEPTQEEIEKRKTERAKELERMGFLPENEGYSETMTSPQEMVEANPRRYIIEECIPACLELWNKNIYTFMVSDHLNEGMCWIEVIEDNLSGENKEIYNQLFGHDVVKFSYHSGTLNFGVECVGKVGQEKLLELAKQFKMQDVPYNQAYVSVQDFLMNYCGCYDEVPNSNYRDMKSPWSMGLPLNELNEYLKKYDAWQESIESKKTLKQFNANKRIKPIEELVTEHNMIFEDDRVYLSEFHYKKHQNYLNYINKINDVNLSESISNFKR